MTTPAPSRRGKPGLYTHLNLARSGTVTLDAGGGGQMVFTVGGYEEWNVEGATLTTNQSLTSIIVPQALFYRNLAIPQNQESATYNGVICNFRGSIRMWTGEQLIVALSNGVPGSIATVTISGDIERRVA